MLSSLSSRFASAATICLLTAQYGYAQDQGTIFSSVAFVRTGERTPIIEAYENVTTLTPFGAQQMSTVGSMFRRRYMPNNSSRIQGLSVNELNNLQTAFYSSNSQYTLAATQAFVQSLYPPYAPSSSTSSPLTNGTANNQYPLGGYQYPWIQAASSNEARSIYTDGASNCEAWREDESFQRSTDYQEAQEDSQKLYAQVAGTLGNEDFPADFITLENAFQVYDYFSWAYNHNSTIRSYLGSNGTLAGALDQLRAYSNLVQWGSYGQSPDVSDPTLNTIAGQTFSLAILSRLSSALQTSVEQGKLNLMFGEFPGMLSFSALAQLPDINQAFYGTPSFGSAMIFELFSPNVSDYSQINDPADLRVRFLFANGTDTIDSPMPSNFTTYPLFNSGSSDMSWPDFLVQMGKVSVSSPGEWCEKCNSWDTVPFCIAYNSTAWDAIDDNDNGNSRGTTRHGRFNGQMSAPLAGVIGAVVTLAALCLILVLLVGCCGMRMIRYKPSAKGGAAAAAGAKSPGGVGAGGFKGSQKLASDPDLADRSPKADKHMSGLSFSKEGEAMGHARVGSWELKQPKRAAMRDEEEDWGAEALGKEVRPDERV